MCYKMAFGSMVAAVEHAVVRSNPAQQFTEVRIWQVGFES